MDTVSYKDANAKNVVVASSDCKKIEDHVNGQNGSDSNFLLPLPRRGGIARKSNKTCRRVQWNDTLGKKLVEVLEYELSDASDSENDDSCICSIM